MPLPDGVSGEEFNRIASKLQELRFKHELESLPSKEELDEMKRKDPSIITSIDFSESSTLVQDTLDRLSKDMQDATLYEGFRIIDPDIHRDICVDKKSLPLRGQTRPIMHIDDAVFILTDEDAVQKAIELSHHHTYVEPVKTGPIQYVGKSYDEINMIPSTPGELTEEQLNVIRAQALQQQAKQAGMFKLNRKTRRMLESKGKKKGATGLKGGITKLGEIPGMVGKPVISMADIKSGNLTVKK